MQREKDNPSNKKALELGSGNAPTDTASSDSPPGSFYSPDNKMEKKSFVQFIKGKESQELLKTDKNAFILLSLIAQRAKRTNSDQMYKDLQMGECYVGDHHSCCLTRQEYRTALKKLKRWQFLTIKSTNKGTIVKLINTDVFDINQDIANQQLNQTATIKQPLLKNDKNDKKKEKKEILKKEDLEFVFLPIADYKKLCQEFGRGIIDSKVEDLENYIGINPEARARKYKDHNRVIRSWLKKDGVKPIGMKETLCPACNKRPIKVNGLCEECNRKRIG